MSDYFNTTLEGKSFEEAAAQVTAELKEEGFGILTEIDMKKTFKEKITLTLTALAYLLFHLAVLPAGGGVQDRFCRHPGHLHEHPAL